MIASLSSNGKAAERVCRQVRDELCATAATAASAATAANVEAAGSGGTTVAERHLASCAACTAFAERLALVREALDSPPSAASVLQPDPGFAVRVIARIARPSELLGWAAFRALPAALGLALALACLGFITPQPPSAAPSVAVFEEPSPSTDQLIAWSAASPEIWP